MDPTTCYTCGIFTELDQLSVSYGREVFNALAPYVDDAFSAFLGLWFAWQLFYRAIFRGDLNVKEVAPKLLLFVVIHLALRTSDHYWSFFYEPVREAMSGLSQLVVAPAGGEVTDRSIPGLLFVVEKQVLRVINLGLGLIQDGGIMNLQRSVSGIILCIPYLFVWGIFMAFMLEGMFKLLAITALAPLVIAAAGFGPTRGFSIASFRVVLNGVLTVVFAAVAMGFTVSILRHYTSGPDIPLDQAGDIAGQIGDISKDKQVFWPMFILGFVSILFHLKAATLASNISGATDGPGAAASVVGAGMATLAWAKNQAMKPVDNLKDALLDRTAGDLKRRHAEAAKRALAPKTS